MSPQHVSHSVLLFRRDKNNRIMEIQKKFLNMFSQHIRGPIPNQMTSSGMMSDPIAAAQRRDAVNILCKDVNNFPISDAITEKTQSFYPSCKSTIVILYCRYRTYS